MEGRILKAELLAPAGNMDMLKAAIKYGADAVYLGLTEFGARASANNFTIEELESARRLTALYGKKIYLTLNTLVKQSEISSFKKTIYDIAPIGIDGIIVQDIGVAEIIKEIAPKIPLHASTQMAIYSASGAKYLKSFGFERVVLARECSIDTIKEVVDTGIDVEVFVHGALCIAMSGQCLISSFNGGRSGNRGRCAQVCRKSFTFDGKKAMHISARDIMLYNILPELLASGVHSLKIEGRLKSPSYVAAVCGQYRKGIDSYYNGEFKKLDAKEYFWLSQAFNRGEFSEGYPGGSEDAGIINADRSNNHGVYIGKVESVGGNLLYIRLSEDIANNDMLRITDGNQLHDFEMIYSGNPTNRGELVCTYLRDKSKVRPGMQVYRLISEKQAEIERNRNLPKIDINLHIELCAGKQSYVRISNNNVSCEIYGNIVDAAKKAPLTVERVKEVFNSTGDYSFEIKNADIVCDNAFMPISKLNELRRKAYCEFEEAIIKKNIKTADTATEIKDCDLKLEGTDKDIIISYDVRLQEYLQSDDIFVFAPKDLRYSTLENEVRKLNKNSYILLHTGISDKDAEYILSLAREYKISGILLDNISQLGLDLNGFNIAIGEHVPVANNYALKEILKYNPRFILAYPELTMNEIKQLSVRPVIMQYGRERLMIFHHCPARSALGLKKGKENCNLCDLKDPHSLIGKSFIDSTNSDYPLIPIFNNEKCIVYMYNSMPTSIDDLIPEGYARAISFVDETLEQQIKIYKLFKTKSPMPKGTLGHFEEGII